MSVAVAVVVATLAGSGVARRWRGRVLRRRLGLGGRLRRPAVDRPGRLAHWLGPRLRAADLDWPPADVARAAGVGAAAVGVVALAGRPVVAVVAVLCAGGVVGALHLAGDRREARLEAELPAVLEAVARAAVGRGPPRRAAGGGLRRRRRRPRTSRAVLAERRPGHGVGRRPRPLGRRRPRPAVRLVVGALTVALGAGGSPARGVDGVAATLRERAEVEREAPIAGHPGPGVGSRRDRRACRVRGSGALGDEATAAASSSGRRLDWPAWSSGLVLDGVGAVWMRRIATGPT